MKFEDLLLWGGLIALGVFAFSGKAHAGPGSGGGDLPTPRGGRDPDPDPSLPGTGGIKPGPGNEGPPPLGSGWGGGQYGPGPIPDNFDWAGNRVWISADCKTIAEPIRFLPIIGAEPILSVWEPLNGGPDGAAGLVQAIAFFGPPLPPLQTPRYGTAWKFVARLAARAARDGKPLDAVDIASRIFREAIELQEADTGVSNLCLQAARGELNPNQWPPGLRDWWQSLIARIEAGLKVRRENWYLWNEFWQVN